MTNVSKLQTAGKDYSLVYTELTKVIAKLNKNTASYLMDELLTDTERIMLVKRFGAIFMFTQDFSPYRVSKTLGISIPTSSRLYAQFSEGHFENLLTCLSKKERGNFLTLLNDIILAQASPKARARLMNQASN